jgi:hypothetical protein
MDKYEIIELTHIWKIKKNDGKLKTVYELPKESYKTREDVERYIRENLLED